MTTRPVRGWRAVAICGIFLLASASAAVGQRTPSVAAVGEGAAPDVSELLARPVSIDVRGVTLGRAIELVSASARTAIVYRAEIADRATGQITLHLSRVPLSVVLDSLLKGTQLRVVALPGPQLGIAVNHEGAHLAALGSIVGVVTDSKTKRGLFNVLITLDDTVQRVRTDEHGRYQLVNVSAGTHHFIAKLVGYSRQARLVTVTNDSVTTLDVALAQSTTNTLDQVVITATGSQRIRELPTIVSVIDADSVVRNSPINDLGELLQSRVPGLEVINSNGGVAGAPIMLRLRGQTSLSLNSEPIVIVDGVRYRSNAIDQNQSQDHRGGGFAASPLNDLNVNDIETVEVVKGPSASTLYGPEASTGVIVITTKRGTAGPTKWHWHAHPVTSAVPEKQVNPTVYTVWGHDANDPLRTPVSGCDLVQQYKYHSCVIDSVRPAASLGTNPNFALLSKNRPTWQYGVDVGGGTQTLRYYLSGNYDKQVGVAQVPPALAALYKRDLGLSSVSDAVRNPNTLANIGTHGSVTADPSPALSLSATVDYGQSTHHRLETGRYFAGSRNTAVPIGATASLSDSNTVNFLRYFYFPASAAFQTTEAHTSRFTGVLAATTRIGEWLTGHADIGVDIGNDISQTVLPGALLNAFDGGLAQDDRRTNVGRTVSLGGTATFTAGIVRFATSAGVQYIYANTDGLSTFGSDLAPGSSSIGTARTLSLQPLWVESITLGTYLQEQLAFYDRLFLDAAIRIDGSSRFGDAYHPAPLPKFGVSWLLSDEPFLRGRLPGVRDLKLRVAYGAATRYPTSFMKLGAIGSGIVTANGQTNSLFDRETLINPDLRPERSREVEYGADMLLFSRFNTSVAWYNRRTLDELKFWSNPTGLAGIWRNSASVAQKGFEATVDLPLFSAHGMQGDIRYTFSHNTNKIIRLGDDPPELGYVTRAKGYPTDAIFGAVSTVSDTVGNVADGIAFPEEIGSTLPYKFMGVYNPPNVSTFSPSLSFFNGHIRLTTVFDRETGFLIGDDFSASCMSNLTCPAAFDPTTPVLLQAKYRANNYFDWLEPGDFTRWREIGLTMMVPSRFLNIKPLHVGFSSASLSLQGRNIAMWTKYKGPDPEARLDLVGSNASGIPLPRAWSFRFDITP